MKANCMKCKHFFITHDRSAPRGCRAFQIKSASLPSTIVKQANNGQECMGFKSKETKSKNERKDLKDSRYW